MIKNTVLIHPGDQFESMSVYYDLMAELAATRQRAPELRPDAGADSPYQYDRDTSFFWVPPVVPALESPAGTWMVRGDRFTWLYTFTDDGKVEWTDPFNKQSGAGKWQIKKDSLVFAWDPPSKTVESWDYPLAPARGAGTNFNRKRWVSFRHRRGEAGLRLRQYRPDVSP